MSERVDESSTTPEATPERAMAPIRWPRPDRGSMGLVGVWVLGVLVAVLVPALVVPPTADAPSVGAVLVAFAFTVVGASVMIGAGWLLYKRGGDAMAGIFGLVPGLAVIIGGIIMVATKLALR